MKKSLLFIAFMLCCCMNAFSQATSLTIDNQTPGWLSSKINYGDQKTLENIKVSGYINSSDISFIGSLILNHSLHGIIDLSDAEITSKLTRRMFGIDIYNNSSQIEVKYLSLPSSMTSPEGCGLLNGLRIDTLEVGGCNYKTIKKNDFYYPDGSYPSNANAKNVKIREGVEVIGKSAFAGARTGINYDNTRLKTISLPSSLKRIEDYAFDLCTSLSFFELPDSIEYLGISSFISSLAPDTLHLPKMLKEFNASNFASIYRPGFFLHIPENVEMIMGADYETYCNYEYTQSGRNPSYLKIDCKIPPRPLTSSSGYHLFFSRFSWECVYVPKGTLEAYQSAYYVPGNNNITNFVEWIEVEKIEIPSMMKLYVGDDRQLSATIIPEDAMNKHIKAMSYDESVVTISQDLTLHPLKHGEAIVKVTADDSQVSADCMVKVFEHTTAVNIQEKIVIPINENRQLYFETLPLKTSDGEILFSTSNDDIAKVDENGNIKAIRRGSCTITATSVDGGYTATCQVTVTQPVEALTMEKHSITLKVGETEELFAQISPATANDKSVTWSSMDEQIASVDANGKVTAKKAGVVTVKAVSNDNAEAQDSCKVTVIQPVSGIQLNHHSCHLNGIGDSFSLEATVEPDDASNKKVKWKSSDESVCVVSNGQVVAVGIGVCVIIATTEEGGYTATCQVTVTQPVEALTMDKHSITLKVGETEELYAQISPATANDKSVTWSSTDEQIASVDANGKVTAKKAGVVTVKAVSNDNAEAQDSCKVTVIQPVSGIQLNHHSCQLNGIGDSFSLEAAVEPDDASNKKVKWKSSDESVCVVSNGQIVAVGIGVCVITATTEDGDYMATCTVTVNNTDGISSINQVTGKWFQVYDANGLKRTRLQQGLNIIRFIDGTRKKVIIR